ncbi:hypothetical protein EYF80_050773 [Liparis tanakae]|uniref:Uncharacterized protein n=1 Tax=Liparis tanakae TaxID=230148 RepID=A0A4Z2FDJ3_9TELE|nr:hypothetical protein EYF80_050773 [Liparis tanakae]
MRVNGRKRQPMHRTGNHIDPVFRFSYLGETVKRVDPPGSSGLERGRQPSSRRAPPHSCRLHAVPYFLQADAIPVYSSSSSASN